MLALIDSTWSPASCWSSPRCVVMVLPALAPAALRAALGDRIAAVLRRIDGFATRHADSAVGWVMGIAGFLLARDAAARLWF